MSEPRKNLDNVSVLLVEDNEMNTLLTSVIVEGLGADVTQANNGMAAIKELQKNRFDIILMDLHMPVMNGFDTAMHIRNELGLSIPIVAITANVINNEKQRCLEAGMNGFVSKPYTEEILLQVISSCLGAKN